MSRAWLNDNDSISRTIGCYFVQFQKNSSFHRNIKRSLYKVYFEQNQKHDSYLVISKKLLGKLVAEEDLDLLLNQQGYDIILRSKDIPAASLKNNI